ncbi:MAG TPA: phosphoenolpyruvate carboxylase [Chloroflexota bacterium]
MSYLGSVLGHVLREQGGDRLFDAVEGLRKACRARRRNESRGDDHLLQTVSELSTDLRLAVVRAFTMYFHLINIAEENHRLRRIAERQIAEHNRPLDQSADAALKALHDAGESAESVWTLLQSLRIRPVFTAHPTEARRMTLLRRLRRISWLIEQRDDRHTPPAEKSRREEMLYAEITGLWQSNELRVRHRTVSDEVRSGLYFFDESVFSVTALIYRELERAIKRWYPELPGAPEGFLSYGSWMGGDRDGNPHVTSKVTEETVAMQAALILTKYEQSIRDLFGILTSSTSMVGVPPELELSLDEDETCLGSAVAELRERYPDELYRQKLGVMLFRLESASRCVTVMESVETPDRGDAGFGRYTDVSDFERDLAVLYGSVCHCAGKRLAREALQDLMWQVKTFGFHLATLDIREHSDRHLAALDEIFQVLGMKEPFSTLPEDRKMNFLLDQLRTGVRLPALDRLSDDARETIDLFFAVRRIQKRFGMAAINTYIVSFTGQSSDLLAVMYLAAGADLFDPASGRISLRVVPLFETAEDLERAEQVMSQLYRTEVYREYLRLWNDEQEIMLGYSDSDKDAGYVSSNWWLYRAQKNLVSGGRKWGIRITFFHGRGGAIGRGGGPLPRAILAQPAGTVDGRIKVTEQGEVLFTRYANPGIAHRHLQQVLNAVITASSTTLNHPQPELGMWETTLADLSYKAHDAYSALVYDDPSFVTFFDEATPVRSIMRLRLASRPAKRGSGTLNLKDLRAIPWVFAWTQSRYGLPGWYGLGSALEGAIGQGQLALLRDMYRRWPTFRWIIDAAQISLGKADLGIARQYTSLVVDRNLAEKYDSQLSDEFKRTVDAVDAVTGQEGLLGGWPLLRRSIELRNPYVDPMSFIQLQTLREVRREEDTDRLEVLRSIIDRSVTGIAAGLQNTG